MTALVPGSAVVPKLCTDCHAAAYGYEPDMGDDFATFAPGTCDRCGSDAGVVWTPADADTCDHARMTWIGTDADLAGARVVERYTCDACSSLLVLLTEPETGAES